MMSRWSLRYRRISAGICAGAPDPTSWRRWTAPTRSVAKPSRNMFKGSRTPCCTIPASGLQTAPANTPPISKIVTCTIRRSKASTRWFRASRPILLILIPAILMAISIVREKELGSIINFYVTPTGRLEYLLGKQLPYIVIGMLNYFMLVAMAIVVFGIPIKGSFLMLTLCTLLYVTATTGIGMVISTFVSSQVAAVFITAIITLVPTIQFSGLLQPVSTLAGRAKLVGSIWPTIFLHACEQGRLHQGARPGSPDAGRYFSCRLDPDPMGSEHARSQEAGEVAVKSLLNIFWLGLKELRSLGSDLVMMLFRHLCVHRDNLHPGDRHLERGQQRIDRFCGRGQFRLIQGTDERLLSAALSNCPRHLPPRMSKPRWTRAGSCSSS